MPLSHLKPRPQHHVLCDHDREAVAGADFESGLDLQVPARGFLAKLPKLLAEGGRDGLLRG